MALSTANSFVKDQRAQLVLIVALALILRAGYILTRDEWPSISGGDYSWYADYGSTLVRTGWTLGPPPTGPVFLLVAGYAEQLNPSAAHHLPGWLLQHMVAGKTLFPNPVGSGQQTIRWLNAILGTLSVLMVYRIGRVAWSHQVGLIAALAVAIAPAFVLEAGNLFTESIAIFLMTWMLAMWLERIDAPDWRLMAACGSLLALSALTRSVMLAFAVIPLTHLLIKHGLIKTLKHGIVLLAAFLMTVSPWTLYNLVQWNRLTLTGDGVLGMLYVGAVGWKAPQDVDAELGFTSDTGANDVAARQEAFSAGFSNAVFSDPIGYIARRGGELAGALLQPHNTTVYSGESLKTLALQWVREDRSLGGLFALMRAEAFWPKLALYVFHYAALLLGAVGLWLNRRRWRDLWPLYLVLAYFLGIHVVLSAIPRYLFPLEPFWWLFGAAVLSKLLNLTHRNPARIADANHSTLQ